MSNENNLMYNYSWGDEDVLSSKITVMQIPDENSTTLKYEITFTQEGFNDESFSDIKTKYTLLGKTITNDINNFDMNVRTIVMLIQGWLNPPPEQLFKIIN